MPCLFFLFWGIVAAFFGGGLLISGWGWRASHKGKSRASTWLFGTAFIALLAALLFGLVSWGVGIWRSHQPSFVFEHAFHEQPGANIQLLHGGASSFLDSASLALSFRTDRTTFDRLRPRQMQQATLKEYQSFHTYFEKGWRVPTEASEIWIHRPDSSDNTSVIMTWDSDGLVQYQWDRID